MSAPLSLGWTSTALRRFDALAKRITARGEGITAIQLRDLGALCRELDRDAPRPEVVAEILDALGLTDADLEAPS